MRLRGVCLFAAIVVASSIATVRAQGSDPYSRNMQKEQRIIDKLKAIAPQQVDNFTAATKAIDRADNETAAKLYYEVLKAAPDFDPAMRRLGGALISSGHAREGFALLNQAVAKNRSPENLITLAQALAMSGNDTNTKKEERQQALSLAAEANHLNEDTTDLGYPLVLANVSLQQRNEAEFRFATSLLESRFPDLMFTHYCKALRAAMDERWIEAENEINKAQKLGLSPDTAAAFLNDGVHTRAQMWRYGYLAAFLVIAWLTGLLLLLVGGKLLSGATLKSIENSDPNSTIAGKEISLRRWYRKVINVAGVYYYISLPFVIFLVLALAAGLTYGFLLLGRIPIKLLLIIDLGALITVYKMIRSLFIRIEAEDPGRSLQEQEAPGLWSLVRQVADTIGTRPVDEIRVTPGTELAVYETGSWRERANDSGRRKLILGVATLNGFKQDAFRAVLAHEYGHLSHRDTAGGDVALRVNQDIMKFANAMALAGQAVWWNLAIHFLRVYHFIFRRISHGATRLQEVLADRVAVRNFGLAAFEEGLTHAIRRSYEFEHVVTGEASEAVQQRRSLRNLYGLPDETTVSVEDKIKEALNRETSEDDTHPSPVERFRLARRIHSNSPEPAPGLVWELFVDREGLTKEMSELVDRELHSVS
ncbi:MAG TPA: M48 family metallopeptidase [Blastocatellia bacterium]|nr:M48 family metallopeptidase [Blastocatellia bacterium]